jgi:hypothetical protein
VGALPELGFDAAQAAALFVVNQRVDQEALLGIGGAVQLVILGGEPREILGFFVEHDERPAAPTRKNLQDRAPRRIAAIYGVEDRGVEDRGVEDRGVRS